MRRSKERRARSLPSWERGLKLNEIVGAFEADKVAPFVGAWIETAE